MTKSKDFNFAKNLKRLEEIVQKLEGQDLGLEEAVDLLAEGISLHRECQEKLKKAQVKVDKLLLAEDKEVS